MAETALHGIRVFLVDDHPAVREGLSLLLADKGLVICGEAGCCADALPRLSRVVTDVVLVDLSLGEESGIDLLLTLGSSPIKKLVYSMHDDTGRVEAALAAGADGYVTKREMAAVLLEAIACVMAGKRYLSPIAAAALRQTAPEEAPLALDCLSERELEVFCKVGEGYSTADLASHFDISPSTVETYYTRIMDKLSLFGTKDLRLRAIRFMKAR